MISKEIYKGHMIMSVDLIHGWECFIRYAPYQWIQSKIMFENSDYAIAYGKAQIDILVSKGLNL
jgi:hypothetical protein